MTPLTEIMDIMIPLVPSEVVSDTLADIQLAKRGLIDMAVRLKLNDVDFITEVNNDGEEVIYCTVDLSLPYKWLASEFAYRAYLLKLKDTFNRSAINFKTLTFEVKGLEKRPESVDSLLYRLEKQLNTDIELVNGTSPEDVIGRVLTWSESDE